MYHSRDITALRSDVAANCRALLELCEAQGLKVTVTETVRDKEYQEWCYKKGTARTKIPSFHAAGLAFDICQNIKGYEYSDPHFFAEVAKIAKHIGFTWGGDWQSFKDLPHFQWDNRGAYSSAMIIAGRLPPDMPEYKEQEIVTYDDFCAFMARYEKEKAERGGSAWSAIYRKWAADKGIFEGDEHNNFMWQAPVTREQLATIAYRLHDEGI